MCEQTCLLLHFSDTWGGQRGPFRTAATLSGKTTLKRFCVPFLCFCCCVVCGCSRLYIHSHGRTYGRSRLDLRGVGEPSGSSVAGKGWHRRHVRHQRHASMSGTRWHHSVIGTRRCAARAISGTSRQSADGTSGTSRQSADGTSGTSRQSADGSSAQPSDANQARQGGETNTTRGGEVASLQRQRGRPGKIPESNVYGDLTYPAR